MKVLTDLGDLLQFMPGEKKKAILLAHDLIGTVRSKSANGLMMHSRLFSVEAIVDQNAEGADTSKVCPGVTYKVPVYKSFSEAKKNHTVEVLILLVPPKSENYRDVENAIKTNCFIINTSFDLLKEDKYLLHLFKKHNNHFVDLRDVTHQRAYPNPEIVNRKSKVVFVTGTDCGLGKRTAAYELTNEAKTRGINAVMYATGQTGLMLGEKGTIVDALIIEYSNGVVSQHVTELSKQGYELIFVEGQSDVYHPANSAVSLALLHGSNPDCIVLVHDDTRLNHKGFEEDAALYRMHPFQKHIDVLEMLSLPCGPVYKTVAIATIGDNNIENISASCKLPVADVRKPGGAAIILDALLQHLEKEYLMGK